MKKKATKKKINLKSIVTKRGFYIALLTLVMVIGTISVVRKFTGSVKISNSAFDDEAWEKAVARVEEDMDSNDVIDGIIAEIPEVQEKIDEEVINIDEEDTIPVIKELSQEEIIASLNMAYPCTGDIIKEHSPDKLIYSKTTDDWRTHFGVDIALEEGGLVLASADGVVEEVYEDDNLGIVVAIGHDGGIKTLYGNLQSLEFIQVGRRVAKGDVIGAAGNTSVLEKKEKSHIHFEILQNGESQDLAKYISL